MLVPFQGVLTPYNAGLTATAYAQPDVQFPVASPSGGLLGGVKVGLGDAAAQAQADVLARYGVGPPAGAASSESGWVAKDQAAHYLTEAEQAASGAWGRVRAGWEQPDCRWLAAAVLIGAYLAWGRS